MAAVATVSAQPSGRLSNLSARGVAAASEESLTAGFVIAGAGPKRVLVRAAGPALAPLGVPGALTEARLELYHGTTFLAANSGWDTGPDRATITEAARTVGAFAFAPGSGDAALLVSLLPGNYTARIVPAREGVAGGVTLAEIYDAEPAAPARLLNLSARARAGTGADALIAGFVVAGDARNRLLVRAAGPSLTGFGVADAVADPQLELFRGTESTGYNDNWEANTNAAQLSAVARAIGAFAFAPGANDSALLLPGAQGAYTAAATPAAGGAGIALIEVYDTASIRTDVPPRVFDLVGFGRVPGHRLAALSGGGAAAQRYDPVTQSGNFWRIDDATAAAPNFPAQFQAAITSDAPLVIELDTMLDLSRVAPPSNGATAIAHPALFAPGQTSGAIGLLGVGSNKTIYSAFGAGGFRRGTLRIDGRNNIILRNLKFRELWEWDDATQGQYDRNDWDYLTIISRFTGGEVTARTHHVWIDHCDFEKSYDGLADIVRGPDLITVSWSKMAGVVSGETARWVKRQFDYLEANEERFPHYRAQRDLLGPAGLLRRELFQFKGNLVGNATDPVTAAQDRGHLNLTFHHNWYVNVDQRMPRMRFGNAHVFNLLADSSRGIDGVGLSRAGIVATSGAAIRVDHAWFTSVRTPVSVRVGFEPVGTILVSESVNYDPVTGTQGGFDPLHTVPATAFAWNPPDAATGITGWPTADPAVMPAGYVPAGTRLADYVDPAGFMLNHLEWVGVMVPADAAEADAWRARWQGTGP